MGSNPPLHPPSNPNPKPPPDPPQPASVNDGLVPSSRAEMLIRTFEGLSLAIYTDAAGNATVGYGHKITHMEHFESPITTQQATDLMLADVNFAAKCVRQMVTVELNQGQFDALCDFVFNEGCGNLADSTLLRLLNLGQYGSAAEQLSRWIYAGGKVLDGLVKRRKAELQVWQTGTFSEV